MASLQIAVEFAFEPRARKGHVFLDGRFAHGHDRGDGGAAAAFHVTHARCFGGSGIVVCQTLKRDGKTKFKGIARGVILGEIVGDESQRHGRATIAALVGVARARVIDEHLIARLVHRAEKVASTVPRKRRAATDAKKNFIYQHGGMNVV